jgi:hypothetical protein
LQITEVPDADLLSRLGHSEGPRSTGLHLSEIYGRMMAKRQPHRFDKSKPMNMNRVETGLLFENMLERALAEKFATVRPGELFSDEGVAMSPDGVNPALMAGEEYKSTWMSSGKGICETVVVEGKSFDVPLPKFEHWFLQMQGYAKWLEVRTFILRVLFINGDYKYNESVDPETGRRVSTPTGPQFKTYCIEFTDQEIEQNWADLMAFAREEGML